MSNLRVNSVKIAGGTSEVPTHQLIRGTPFAWYCGSGTPSSIYAYGNYGFASATYTGLGNYTLTLSTAVADMSKITVLMTAHDTILWDTANWDTGVRIGSAHMYSNTQVRVSICYSGVYPNQFLDGCFTVALYR